MRRVRLVIADRRPIVLQGFVSLLEAQPDFEVVACCLDGASCLAAIRSLTPDVVLLEDEFTDVTASDILAVVDDEGLSSRLVFFTATVACSELARALATGACGAISMNTKPEALVQFLRLEKPGSDLARISNEANGIAPFGNNVQAVLTVNERTIMDLVADGLSDSEIARVLGVSLEVVKIHIKHARQKLGINSRTELAALALSRRYGAMSILTAAILAALDDSGHAATESVTVMPADGCAEVVTIKFSRKDAVSGGTPSRGASKVRTGAATGASSPTSTLIDPVAEIAASLFAQTAPNAPRRGSSSYSIYMVAAFAAFIYELDGAKHAVQAFDFGDRNVTSSTAIDANGPASALPGFVNFDGTAVDDAAFAFEFAQGDTIAIDGSELHVGNAHTENGGKDREVDSARGSRTVDVAAAAAHEVSQHDSTQTGRDNGSNEDRSQSDLRATDNSSGAAKGHEAAGDDANRGQSQKALHESDNSSGAANGHAKHAAPGEDPNRGQVHGDRQTFESSSAAGKQNAHHPKAVDLDARKPQSDIPTTSASSPNDAHSAVGTELSDSFHFKKGAGNTSSDMCDLQQLSYGNGIYGEGQHAVARDEPEPEPVQNAGGIDISNAHHDHSGHANLHAAHDLIV